MVGVLIQKESGESMVDTQRRLKLYTVQLRYSSNVRGVNVGFSQVFNR